ncbi:MAG: twin-arginine translocase subunit TatC [Candidatus Saccharimonas sp.]
MKRRKTNNPSGRVSAQTTALPTLLDHVRELQSRLFVIGIAFAIAAAATVPFFDKIVAVLMAPLSPEQKLVYLTPGGAINFMIKVCMYVGIICVLPVVIFHLYRFLMPVVRRMHLRTALKYTFISIMLAGLGIIFAYFVSLPASLYFLTNFNLYHIDPMLTIDSYLSFVMAYVVAGAALFQLPLVMTIIDSIRPQTPKKLMKQQRFIIVGSFVVAAILTPTPDALNQTIMASPIIVMYQVGIVIIAWKHRKRKALKRTIDRQVQPMHNHVVNSAIPVAPTVETVKPTLAVVPSAPKPRLITDMRRTAPPTTPVVHVTHATRPNQIEQTLVHATRSIPQLVPPRRSIDGIIIPKRA